MDKKLIILVILGCLVFKAFGLEITISIFVMTGIITFAIWLISIIRNM